MINVKTEILTERMLAEQRDRHTLIETVTSYRAVSRLAPPNADEYDHKRIIGEMKGRMEHDTRKFVEYIEAYEQNAPLVQAAKWPTFVERVKFLFTGRLI